MLVRWMHPAEVKRLRSAAMLRLMMALVHLVRAVALVSPEMRLGREPMPLLLQAVAIRR